jgi:hypothetical protein
MTQIEQLQKQLKKEEQRYHKAVENSKPYPELKRIKQKIKVVKELLESSQNSTPEIENPQP